MTNKFKVGDWVKWVGTYPKKGRIEEEELEEKGKAKILDIASISKYGLCLSLEGIDKNVTHGFYFSDLELVEECQPKFGDKYEVSDDDFKNSFGLTFYKTDNNLRKPYLTLEKGTLTNWKAIREIKPRYKAYEEVSEEMIGIKLKEKRFGEEYEIVGLALTNTEEVCIRRYNMQCFFDNLEDLYNKFTLPDGTPFGEELK